MSPPLVPPDFNVPVSFDGPGFQLEPLGPEHNERDYDAWTSSIEHIKATPGFEESDWPHPMSLEANLSDLVRHADDFANRKGFTYSVLDGDAVIGCIYIYPTKKEGHDVSVASWVRQSRAEMDVVVWRAVSDWIRSRWPFQGPLYAARKTG
jgi:hypothetical protein